MGKIKSYVGTGPGPAGTRRGYVGSRAGDPRTRSIKKKALFLSLLFLIPAFVAAALYAGYVVYRTDPIYNYVKSGRQGWRGTVFRSDRKLGLAPVPGSRGELVFPAGPPVPVRFDGNGFRIPAGRTGDPIHKRPLLLALGCSFTFGYGVGAEDSWPYLAGRGLGGSAINAGVPSYGLCQMLILARRLIPACRPDFVAVQYSPWLVRRAMSPFAPAYFGKLPVPYFRRSDPPAIAPPVFQTKITELPTDRYYASPGGALDYLSFLWHVGLPLFIHDDFHMIDYRLKRAFSLTPLPASNGEEVARFVYGEIGRLVREIGARLVIVILGKNSLEVRIPSDLFPVDAIVLDAHGAMIKLLGKSDNKAYLREYAHWRGSPPRLIDSHPNGKAHRIIGEQVVMAIQGRPFPWNRP